MQIVWCVFQTWCHHQPRRTKLIYIHAVACCCLTLIPMMIRAYYLMLHALFCCSYFPVLFYECIGVNYQNLSVRIYYYLDFLEFFMQGVANLKL